MATTSRLGILEQLELDFDVDIKVPEIMRPKELDYVMRKSGGFDKEEIQAVLSGIEHTTGKPELGIGIKSVLVAIDTATNSEDKIGRFIQKVSTEVMKDKREIVFGQ